MTAVSLGRYCYESGEAAVRPVDVRRHGSHNDQAHVARNHKKIQHRHVLTGMARVHCLDGWRIRAMTSRALFRDSELVQSCTV